MKKNVIIAVLALFVFFMGIYFILSAYEIAMRVVLDMHGGQLASADYVNGVNIISQSYQLLGCVLSISSAILFGMYWNKMK